MMTFFKVHNNFSRIHLILKGYSKQWILRFKKVNSVFLKTFATEFFDLFPFLLNVEMTTENKIIQMTHPRIFWEPFLVKAVKSKKLILLTDSLKFVLGFLLLFSQAYKFLQSQSFFFTIGLNQF